MKSKNTLTRKLLALAVLPLALAACAPSKSDRIGGEFSTSGFSSVFGGTEVPFGHAMSTSVVALLDFNKGGLCTGTLIGNNLILTAAHCIGSDPTKMVVVFHTSLVEAQKNPTAHARPVNGATVATVFPGTHLQNGNLDDIALVHYAGSTPSGYRPADLLPAQLATELRPGMQALLVGYGVSTEITDKPGSGSGSGLLRYINLNIASANSNLTEVTLSQHQGFGVCRGDSGGPAFVSVRGRVFVWGVTSRVSAVNCQGSSIYTSAAAYETWIRASADLLVRRYGHTVAR